jgi:hypothetical protein
VCGRKCDSFSIGSQKGAKDGKRGKEGRKKKRKREEEKRKRARRESEENAVEVCSAARDRVAERRGGGVMPN